MDVFVPPFNASILTWMHSAGPLWGDSNPKLLERPRGAQTFCHLYEVWSEWKSLAPFWDLSTCFTHSFFFCDQKPNMTFSSRKNRPVRCSQPLAVAKLQLLRRDRELQEMRRELVKAKAVFRRGWWAKKPWVLREFAVKCGRFPPVFSGAEVEPPSPKLAFKKKVESRVHQYFFSPV